jgi:hypothetical protein
MTESLKELTSTEKYLVVTSGITRFRKLLSTRTGAETDEFVRKVALESGITSICYKSSHEGNITEGGKRVAGENSCGLRLYDPKRGELPFFMRGYRIDPRSQQEDGTQIYLYAYERSLAVPFGLHDAHLILCEPYLNGKIADIYDVEGYLEGRLSNDNLSLLLDFASAVNSLLDAEANETSGGNN